MKNKYKIIVIVVIVFLLSSFYFWYSLGITIDNQDNLYYQNGFENESIKIKTQINKLYENLYLFENEKLSYNLILFNDNFLLLININDQTYDKLEKVSNTQVFL